MFKYIAVIVVLAVVGVSAYLFYMHPDVETKRPQETERGAQIKAEAEVPRYQGNPVPAGAVFEDGTIPE